MITHTSDSHQIPSQNKTKSKLQILKQLPKIQLLDKMCKYEIDPTNTVSATEWTRDGGRTDGWSETSMLVPPNNFVVRGYNYNTVPL